MFFILKNISHLKTETIILKSVKIKTLLKQDLNKCPEFMFCIY